MDNHDALAQRYIDIWNTTDPATRRRRIQALFTPDARYVDPLVAVEGPEAIDETVAAVQGQFPDLEFRLGPVDGHHHQARFTWELGPAEGQALVVGLDVAVADDDGRLTQVYGFLDKVPAASPVPRRSPSAGHPAPTVRRP
jgi:hypothetical protein